MHAFLRTLRRSGRRRVPVLVQMTATDCGPACVAMVLSTLGRETTVAETRDLVGSSRDGANALGLLRAARSLGLGARALSVPPSALATLPVPAIAHWQGDHFVVVERVHKRGVTIVDPARGRLVLPLAEFAQSFAGVALVFEPGAGFRPRRLPSRPRWRRYLGYVRPYRRHVGVLVGASLLLPLGGLAVPAATAFVVDRVIPARHADVLPMIVAGVAIVALHQAVVSVVRQRLLVYLQARVDVDATTTFVRHLLSLPLPFFERRGSGDLLARVSANTMIRETLSAPVLSAFLDGTFVLGYLAILLAHDAGFAGVVVCLAVAQSAVLLALTIPLARLSQRELFARAETHNYLFQALAGIATVKASGVEDVAGRAWRRLFASEVRASVALNTVQARFTTITVVGQIVAPIALLLFGARQVTAGSMSLGEMFGLIALGSAFLAPFASVVTNIPRIRRASAYLDRVLDVLESPPEEATRRGRLRRRIEGRIDVDSVSFQYDRSSPLALREVSLAVARGEKLVVAGRTGSGKSTLVKLLLGLYAPTAGRISYDGIDLEEFELVSLRAQFGSVLQEPVLFSGTIRDNIALHAPDASESQIVEAARLAEIHDEIAQMPMGYDTWLREGGGGLSGGQRQRVALARALAPRPAVLVLDEATSHLDALTERRINENLRRRDCTQIVIAHRLSTIRDADLIVVLDEGRVAEAGSHAELVARNGHYAALVDGQLERKTSVG